MKRIPLTQGQFALVDDEWYDYLNRVCSPDTVPASIRNYWRIL